MGLTIAPKPDWQITEPAKFKSFNPLVRKEVILDTYKVLVPEYNSKNEKTGEHEELCVTHKSLLRWYQMNLMPNGGSVHYDVITQTNKAGIVVKCTIEKEVSPEETRYLIGQGYTPNNVVHVESLGEASCDNCNSDISKKHQATTAENRSFDRALIRYLTLDLSGYGTDSIYSSSEEIGKPAETAEEKQEEPVNKPEKVLEKAPENPTPKDTANESQPSWLTGVSITATAQERKVEPAKQIEKPEDASIKYKADREEAVKTQFSEEEYKKMLALNFNSPINTIYNGKTIGELIQEVRDGNDDVGKTMQTYVKYRPMQAHNLAVWRCLISYLAREGLIVLYPSGKTYIGKKDK